MNKGKIVLILLIIVILLGFFLWKSSQEKTDEGAYIPETPEINGEIPAQNLGTSPTETTPTSEDANLDELNAAVKDLESLLQTQKSEKDLDDANVGIQ